MSLCRKGLGETRGVQCTPLLRYTVFVEEWTQQDFEHMINTVQSRSELDDIIETIWRIHHKTVAGMQSDYHNEVNELMGRRQELAKSLFARYEAGNMMEADSMALGYIMQAVRKRAQLANLCVRTMYEVTKDRIKNAKNHFVTKQQLTRSNK